MSNRICILLGHPHDDPGHFCHALADAYERGAREGGAEVDRIDVARCAPGLLADPADFDTPPESPEMLAAREAIAGCGHLVVIFPLWLGTMPAMLKAFFEQMARAGFAISGTDGGLPKGQLKGKSARIVVSMGMPALAYRIWFLNSGVSNLKRMILGLSGFGPIRQTTIGSIENMDQAARQKWLEKVEALGRQRK